MCVLREAVVFGEDRRCGVPYDAGHERALRKALLLHQQRQRLISASARRHLEHAGLIAIGVEDRPHVQALKQRATPRDILGQLLDRDPGLHAPDVRLAEHQLVEGYVARGREGDFLGGGFCHRSLLRDGRREPLSRTQTRHEAKRRPLPLGGQRRARRSGRARERKAGNTGNRISGFTGFWKSGRPIEQFLGFRLHVETRILMRLAPRHGGDALHEVEDRGRWPPFLLKNRFDDPGGLGLRKSATT